MLRLQATGTGTGTGDMVFAAQPTVKAPATTPGAVTSTTPGTPATPGGTVEATDATAPVEMTEAEKIRAEKKKASDSHLCLSRAPLCFGWC